MYYILRKYKNKGYFYILTDIGEHVTLLKLIDYVGDVNHAIIVAGYWIFDSKYGKALLLNREYLDMIFTLSVGEKQLATFETAFFAMIKIRSTAHLKKE